MQCDIDGVTLHYDSFGEGRPFLGLHGFPLDRTEMIYEFDPVMSARDGWRRVYVDLPGHGESPRTPWPGSNDRLLDLLVDFVDAVFSEARFAVAGTSYGGLLAHALAQRLGDRLYGLCLNVPLATASAFHALTAGKIGDLHVPARTIIADEQVIAALPDEDLRGVCVSYPISAERYCEMLGRTRADLEYVKGVAEGGSEIAVLSGELSTYTGPTLIMAGRQDVWCGYRDAWDLVELYPRATFAVLDRAGHFLRGEQEQLFIAFVNDWLDRTEEAAAAAG